MSDESIAEPKNVVLSRVCMFWMNGPIMFARFLPRAEVTLTDAQEAMAVMARLGGGILRPLLVDLREIRSQTGEARGHFAGPEGGEIAAAVGLLVGSPISRVIGNFFLGINRTEVPLRLFSEPGAALDWLHQYVHVVAA